MTILSSRFWYSSIPAFNVLVQPGESGLRISAGTTSNKKEHDLNKTALLGHKAKEYYNSLDCVAASMADKSDEVEGYLKSKYGEGNVREKICVSCERKCHCLSADVYANESGMMQYYSNSSNLFYVCMKDGGW